MKIMIVDDFPVVVHGLKRLLQEEFPQAEIREVLDGNTAVKLATDENWDLIILDIQMQKKDGLEVLREINSVADKKKVLMLSMFSEEIYAIRSMKLGAYGYITKRSAPEQLITAVKQILEGKKYISGTLAEKIAGRLKKSPELLLHEQLSDREMRVLSLIVRGKEVGEIAKELCLSVSTISTYRHRILKKMEMKTNSELIRYSLQNEMF
ncbi:MAG: response regulator transcription factor [Bacteroidetes bacterium]|nr:MAG: response regulator transcription factor [Bacteroidota bacterium]